MRATQLLAAGVFTLGLITAGISYAVPGGARGVVDRKLEGVGSYNQAIDDAMNGGEEKKPPAAAAPQPGALKTGWITRKSSDGKDVRLYFAYPQDLTKAKATAGLIVLQEYWGLNEETQERTRAFASKGFYAVSPDLYYGKVTEDPAEALNLRNGMTDIAAMTAMKMGLDLLQEEQRNGLVDAKRVGAVGWDLGGHQALLLAMADSRVRATAVICGPLLADYSKLKPIQGPILGIFAGNDKAPSPADVKKWQESFMGAGMRDLTVYQIDGAAHGFASKASAKTGAYDEAKAKDAMDKLNAWLDAKLPR